jgi:hypothetical protein
MVIKKFINTYNIMNKRKEKYIKSHQLDIIIIFLFQLISVALKLAIPVAGTSL